MSDTVDLMVVGMAEELSAEELSARLVKEFKQPADAFDALISAATGAGPAYAAQSDVSLDMAVEGKEKLESLGIICTIPGVTDQPSANLENSEVESVCTDDAPGCDGDDSAGLTELSDAVFDLPGVDESDSLPSFEVASDEVQQSTATVAEPVADGADDSNDAFDFSDELDALDTVAQLSNSNSADRSTAQEPASESADLACFDDALDDLQSLNDDVATEAQFIEEETVLDNTDSAASLADEQTELKDPAPEESVPVLDNSDAKDISAVAMDIGDIAISNDEDTPLTKRRESSDVELDDGGLSLTADDDIAPIKAAAKDVPAALADRSTADTAEELSLSIDSEAADDSVGKASEPVTGLNAALADDLPELADGTEQLSEADAQQKLELNVGTEGIADGVVDAELHAQEAIDTPDVNEVSEADDAQAIALSQDIADMADELSGSDTVAGSITEPSSEKLENNNTQAVENSIEESQAVKPAATKSIAEELIESLQGNEAPEPLVVAAQPVLDATVNSSPAVTENDEQELLRKSREQVAVLKGKIEEDLEEEEQIYQEFEQIAKKRAVQKVLTGVAAVAVIGAVGGGVHFSGMLTPAPEPEPVVAAAEIVEPDREQESLKAAIERSATLINPETLSTEELLVTLAQGSAQDSLGDLRRYILGGSARVADNVEDADNIPRAGAAIPADSNSMKLLKNRVPHSGDKYFDEWSRREIDLRLYIELVDRLIDAGDIVAATELCNRTKDNLFAVMGRQSVARAYSKQGNRAEALRLLEMAARNTYSIAAATERVVAMADYAYSEHVIGQSEDSLDSYLSVSILAASLNRSEYKTIGHATVSDYLMRAGQETQSRKQLDRAISAAFDLPSNSAARDLALRHIALTEAQMGLFEEAIAHTEQIIDPFASVSAFHGIALEYELRKDYAMATEVIQKAFDASSVIEDKEKRRQLLSKIQLANSD